jgi:hypothetical protein
VHEAILMTVLDAADDLVEIEPSKVLVKGAGLLDQMEQLTLTCDLESNEEDLLAAGRLLVQFLTIVYKFNDIRVVEILQSSQFFLEINQEALGHFFEDLQSNFAASRRIDG